MLPTYAWKPKELQAFKDEIEEMVIRDQESGELKEVNETTVWGIFPYMEGEDIKQIVGTCPLIYRTYEDLLESDGRDAIIEWVGRGYTIVIRTFKCVVK